MVKTRQDLETLAKNVEAFNYTSPVLILPKRMYEWYAKNRPDLLRDYSSGSKILIRS